MIAAVTGADRARRWAGYVADTRNKHGDGSCYVHAVERGPARSWEYAGMRFTWTSWGRSINGGGHKHKAYCHYAATGNVMRTKDMMRRIEESL